MPRRDGVIKEEHWTDFHQKHHSRAYHFSCANEKILHSSADMAPTTCFLFGDNDEESWLGKMLDALCRKGPKQSDETFSPHDSYSSLNSSQRRAALQQQQDRSSRRNVFKQRERSKTTNSAPIPSIMW